MEFINTETVVDVEHDYLLLLERAESPIGELTGESLINEEDVFEGTAAVLDVANDNNRIYDKEEYLKHLPYLQEKIKRGRLFGEIDHPRGYYDVELKNISHRIDKLWYDEESNTIKIRIKLLRGTPGGDLARKLVDLGIPLAISSRAIGKVVDNRPQILRIFTYDLVAEPGFRESILHPTGDGADLKFSSLVGESLEYITESLTQCETESITSQCNLLNENENYSEYLKIYKINNEKIKTELDSIFENSSPTQNNLSDMDQKEFTAYTDRTQKEISDLKSVIIKMNEGLQEVQNKLQGSAIQASSQIQGQDTLIGDQLQPQDGLQVQQGTTELPNISDTDGATEALDKVRQYVDFMSTELTKISGEQDAVQQTQQTIQADQQIIQESIKTQTVLLQNIGVAVNKTINHENLLTKKVNETLNFLDIEVVPTLNESANTTNVQSYLITKLIEMSDHLSDKTNDALNYGNFLGSVSEAHAGFMNLLAENVDGVDNFDPKKKYVQTEAGGTTKLNESKDSGTGVKKDAIGSVTNLNETKQPDIVNAVKPEKKSDARELFEKLNTSASKILERIDENSQSSILKAKFPFLKLMGNTTQQRFFDQDTETKQEIVTTLEKGVYFNEGDITSIMEGIIAGKNAHIPNYLKFIPEEFKPIYENLGDSKRYEIENLAKSGFYNLDTPYQVKSFWHSIDGLNEALNTVEVHKLEQFSGKDKEQKFDNTQNLNESANNVPDQFVYGSSFISDIMKR